MNGQEAMAARHAVRDYADSPVDEGTLLALREAIERANEEGDLNIQLIHDETDAFGGCPTHYGRFKGVRYCIALIGPDAADRCGRGLDERVGYYGESLALKAVTLGLSTSWVVLHDTETHGMWRIADGERIEVGDTGYRFGIESVSKVPTAILAMKQHGTQPVMKKIGADATGLPFNSIIAILLENDHPSTPLVNAGAITACSMIAPTGNSDAKWLAIKGFVESLCGSAVEVIDELYRSESATNFNNRSIAWLLKNYGRIYDDPDLSLDIYTHQCSIGITASQLAVMAATIAADGRNPVTHDEVFAAEIAPRIVSLMSTVGFYERTGDWMFQTGIPAKSGVGGGIMGVIPGVMGIAAFAPPLDAAGNSVKAQKAVSYIAKCLGLNIYSSQHATLRQPVAVEA